VVLNRILAFPIMHGCMILAGIVLLPMSIPVLRPQTWLTYTKAMHLYQTSGNSENESSGVLPQFYADRFGWQEEVDQVTRIYESLSPADKAVVGIGCSNYGEAGAINFLGHGLPSAISGHNNYWIWGPQGYSGDVMIIINGNTPEEMRKSYDSVEIAGRMDHPLSMPYERRNIYLVRGRHKSLGEDWLSFKHYI
jgi:hypothetical protein